MTRFFDAPQELYDQLETVVSRIESARALVSRLQAAEAALLVEAGELADQIAAHEAHPDGAAMAHRMVASEIGTAVKESDRTVATRMARAATLVNGYPSVYESFRSGRISAGHTVVITEAGQIISDENQIAAYEAEVLEFAENETVGRLRPVAKELAEKYADRTLDERHTEARSCRMVKVIERPDGMADLIATLPAVWAYGVKDRLDQMARLIHDAETTAMKAAQAESGSARAGSGGASGEGRGAGGASAGDRGAGGASADSGGAGDGDGAGESAAGDSAEGTPELVVRTYDQIRADSLVDMLLASNLTELAAKKAISSDTIKARVQVFTSRARVEETYDTDELHSLQVPLAGLAGYGPIDTESARHIAGIASSWDIPEVNTETGDVITVETYRPSAAQRRFLAARDEHCRFPGCRVPVRKCDLDHTVAAADGGPTSTHNLSHLCRRHHTMKHATPWKVTQRQNGDLEWESPLGRKHRDRPPSRVRFRSSGQEQQCRSGSDDARHAAGPRGGDGAGAGAGAYFEPVATPFSFNWNQ